jgi:hypothetical protein
MELSCNNYMYMVGHFVHDASLFYKWKKFTHLLDYSIYYLAMVTDDSNAFQS